jgi:hypothetical protein
MSRAATYVYAVLDHRARPRVAATVTAVPGGGPVRLLPIAPRRSLVVSDVPLSRYGEAALARKLSDLEWVSRVALAHERVVEAFLSADAVLPMKLFTIFASDERAVAHVTASSADLDTLARRVARRQEWGVRLTVAAMPASPGDGVRSARKGARGAANAPRTGAAYLQHKKAVKDAASRRAEEARGVASSLFQALASHATEARRRSSTELPVQGGPLILDAALLVPRSAAARFKAAAARHARALSNEGYTVALSGPWPPYSFMRD